MRPRSAVLAALGIGLVTTLSVTLLPFIDFAYRSPGLHVAIEAFASFVALLAAYLLYGRYRARRDLGDLALIAAFALFGTKSLIFETIPAAAGAGTHAFLTWAPLTANVLATATFAAAPFLPQRRLASPGRACIQALAAVLLVVAAVAEVVLAARNSLPLAIHPTLSPSDSNRPLAGNEAVFVVQLVTTLLYAIAAFGFARRAEKTRDDLLTFIAVAAALGTAARLNYALFPSIHSQWVYTGDALRLAQWLVILVGLVREIRAYWVRLARAAVLEERTRMARALHDGVAQELAFIATESRRLGNGSGSAAALHNIRAAADRALDESRSAIAAFAAPSDECIAAAIARAAEDVADREGVSLRFDLDENVAAERCVREDLIRIVREAVTNATRHGRASAVRVTLRADDRFVNVRVSDDGVGFDAAGPTLSGFGLRSMRERAQSLGGDFRVESQPGSGTAVEVQVPRWPASA
jgi:signal transduction histidine kinase